MQGRAFLIPTDCGVEEQPNMSAKNSRGSAKTPALAGWPNFLWNTGQSG